MKSVTGMWRRFRVLGVVVTGSVLGSVSSAMAIESKPVGDSEPQKPRACQQAAEQSSVSETPASSVPQEGLVATQEAPSPSDESSVAESSGEPSVEVAPTDSTESQVSSEPSIQVQVELTVTQSLTESVGEIAVLEALSVPVRGRVEKCESELAEAQQALAVAMEDAQRSRDITTRRLGVIVQLRDLFASEQCEIEWKGQTFSRESVGEALRHQITLYRLEREESARRDEIEASRRTQLEAVEARVLKWRREEEELVRMVEVLKAEAAATAAAGDAPAIQDSTREEAAALSQRIEEMLGVTTVAPLEDADRRLLEEADTLIETTSVSSESATSEPTGSE